MSETPVVPVAPVVPAVVPPVAPQVEAKPPWGSDEDFDPAKAWDLITKLREQKNDPAAAKELSELRNKVTSFEDEKRTEVEKAVARAETAEKALSESAAKVLRAEIAASKGVPAALLSGDTQAELEAAADALLAFKGPIPTAPSADGQGDVGDVIGAGAKKQLTQEDVSKLYAEKKYDEIEAARADGRLATLLGPPKS